MKESELRIGNWVFDDYSGDLIVHVIHPNWVNLHKPWSSVVGQYEYKNIKPIPLTEEWLLKFGFENRKYHLSKDTHWANANYLYYNKDETKIRMEVVSRRNTTINFNHIKHVHQLQNLYFALTGEELKIKP